MCARTKRTCLIQQYHKQKSCQEISVHMAHHFSFLTSPFAPAKIETKAILHIQPSFGFRYAYVIADAVVVKGFANKDSGKAFFIAGERG